MFGLVLKYILLAGLFCLLMAFAVITVILLAWPLLAHLAAHRG